MNCEAAAIAELEKGRWPTVLRPIGEIRPDGDVSEGKDPFYSEWGLKRPTPEELNCLFAENPNRGVGRCVGPGMADHGGWMADVEGDGPEAEDSRLRLFGGEIVRTLGHESARGTHEFYLVDGRRLLKALTAIGAESDKEPGVFKDVPTLPDLELRVGGFKDDGKTLLQIQCAIPPTIGTDGQPRKPNGIENAAPFPEVGYLYLECLAERMREREAIQHENNGAGARTDPARGNVVVTDWTPAARQDAYGRKALEEEGEQLAALAKGTRHLGSLPISMRLAGLVKAGIISEADCRATFTESLSRAGLPEGEIKKLIDSALAKATPRKNAPDFTSNARGKPTTREQVEAEQEKKTRALLATYKPKTFGTIGKAIGDLKHLWENWLVLGSVSMIWSKPKVGKTRIYIALMRYLWSKLIWPDGTPNQWPAESKVAVLPYDRNHLEIANEMKLAGIPDEAALCVHDPRDDTGISLLSLTDPLMLSLLEKTLADDPAILLIAVDTFTYASEKSLCKPEDMKASLDGIMLLAQKYGRCLLLLMHENKEGEALGRRIDERARVLIKLERYNQNEPSKLRMFVKESNFPKRPSLSVTHTDTGLVFEQDRGEVGKVADRQDACARWLIDYLWKKGVDIEVDFGTLINAAGYAGFAGELSPFDNRWSDRMLLSRAIQAVNAEAPSLQDFHMFKIDRKEQSKFGRAKPVILYALKAENMPPM
jgi:hypothetical protein